MQRNWPTAGAFSADLFHIPTAIAGVSIMRESLAQLASQLVEVSMFFLAAIVMASGLLELR